jgi:hypothetical protein
MLSVDHVFRLSCMPETCTQPRHHQIVQAITVSSNWHYSRPVRVMDAAYLDLPYTVWTPTDGRGNTREQYVAVLPQHAQLYCSRLRTGGHSDWRVPDYNQADRLRWPSSHNRNQLWTRFGWPTGDLPYQSSLQRHFDSIGTSIAGNLMYNDAAGTWYPYGNPYPLSCVR